MPRAEYGLEEPSLTSPISHAVLDSSWRVIEVPSQLNSTNRAIPTNTLRERPLQMAVSKDNLDTLWISNRRVELKGVMNTRDLGGIRTSDDRQVRWGLLYRSGHLHKLKSRGANDLNNLGIRTVVDLRTDGEVEEKPDRLPEASGIDYRHIPISGITSEDLERTEHDIREQTPAEFDGAGKMTLVMSKFAIEGAGDFAQIFGLLLDERNYPLLYHCSAGKDRTGLLTALILSSVGVPRDVIFDEYLLSNYFRYDRIERNARVGAWFVGIDPASSRPIMNVEAAYLQSSFDAIDREYGSVDSYLEEGLGLTPSDRETLKTLLLY